jgi:hypothetical protein
MYESSYPIYSKDSKILMMKYDKIIQHASFEMFRDWSKIASDKYPDIDFTIVDETELVNDTKKCIDMALESLFSSEYYEKRHDRDWCIGFVKGYIKGSIGRQWFHEYYQKQTDNYRNMIALKSILEYFKVDSDLSWRLDAIYKEFFFFVNLEFVEFNTKIDVDFKKKYTLPATNQKGIVKQAFDNLVIMFIKNMTDESSFEFPDKDYFTDEEILFFIKNKQETI